MKTGQKKETMRMNSHDGAAAKTAELGMCHFPTMIVVYFVCHRTRFSLGY